MRTVRLGRVYDKQESHTGAILVDRLWPRGIAKNDAPFDEWMKDIAPSTGLRKWYGHEPARFEEFSRRYRDELSHSPAYEAVSTLQERARTNPITLLTATKDVERSAAAVLRDVLLGN